MKNSSLVSLIVAAGIASGCGARTSEDDILDYSRPVQTGGDAGITGGSGGQGVGGTGGTGVGGSSNECCAASAAPGCRDTLVAECVCQVDSFCCSSRWDQACVDRAEQSCGALCMEGTGGVFPTGGAPPTGGSFPTGGVSPAGGSTGGVSPTGGSPPTGGTGGTLPGGDCCSAHTGQGCQVTSVQECVCDEDPFCCNNNWDNLCADRAIACGADCGMGGTGGSVGGGGTGGMGTGGDGTETCVELFPGTCGSCLCTECFNEFTQCLNDKGCGKLLACSIVNGCACEDFP